MNLKCREAAERNSPPLPRRGVPFGCFATLIEKSAHPEFLEVRRSEFLYYNLGRFCGRVAANYANDANWAQGMHLARFAAFALRRTLKCKRTERWHELKE